MSVDKNKLVMQVYANLSYPLPMIDEIIKAYEAAKSPEQPDVVEARAILADGDFLGVEESERRIQSILTDQPVEWSENMTDQEKITYWSTECVKAKAKLAKAQIEIEIERRSTKRE